MKKYFIIIAVIAAVSLTLLGCSTNLTFKNGESNGRSNYVNNNNDDNGDEEAMVKKITPEEAKKLMETRAETVLLDVRTQAEYEEKHIPNSVLIPLDTIPKQVELQLSDKNVPILVYCRSGNRSKTAAAILVKLGYKDVYDLGGIMSWPFETKKGK